mmetsp:Transcript_18470/g.39677  ORF Transcript_18470/g.39677 Transcript_18470/m.39677 type:complete len:226 (+) Transcript_18470:937-1614(+)
MANELGIAICGGRAGMGSRLDAAWMPFTVAFSPSAASAESQRRISLPASCTAPPPTVTTTSASAALASSAAESRPSSPPPMPMLVKRGAASMPLALSESTNFPSPPSRNLAEDLFARTKTFFEPKEESSSMAAWRKGDPTRTAFMPGGICSGGMERDILIAVLLKLLSLSTRPEWGSCAVVSRREKARAVVVEENPRMRAPKSGLLANTFMDRMGLAGNAARWKG